MKRGYSDRKWLNENLAPLARYLESQVSRPWDKVYGEICARIDTRSTVKRHILQHVGDFVALQVKIIDGEIMIVEGWRDTYTPLEQSAYKLFVDPRTGILRENRRYTSWNQRKRDKAASQTAQQSAVRREIGERVQLHRLDGVWYRVELDTLPAPREILRKKDGQWIKERVFDACRDVLRHEWVTREHGRVAAPGGKLSNEAMYGKADWYAVSKRQLNSRELQKYGLQS